MNTNEPTEFFDFSKPNNRRSFAFLALAAIVGLGIAGYGLFTAKGTVTNTVPPEYAAIVNQRPIYRSDFNLQVKAMYDTEPDKASAEQKHKVLEDMINEELLVQRGLETDLASFDQNVRAALVGGMETDMYASVQAKKPTDDELKAFYQQHIGDYASPATTRLRDLKPEEIPYEEPAARNQRLSDAVAALRGGMKIEAAMKRFQLRDALLDQGKPDVSALADYALQGKLPEKVYAALTQLKSGDVSGPVPAEDGEHILVVLEHTPSVRLEFEAVRDQVVGDLTRAEQQRVWDSTMKYLRGKSVILTGKE